MVKKIAVLAAVLSLSVSAQADRVAGNLKGLRVADFCGTPIGMVFVDGQQNQALTDRLTQVLREQDLLFDSKFDSQGKQCKIFAGLEIFAITVKANNSNIGYAYSYRFTVYPMKASVEVDGRKMDIAFPNLYDLSGIGTSSISMASFQSDIEDVAENMFKSFLLDWRQSH